MTTERTTLSDDFLLSSVDSFLPRPTQKKTMSVDLRIARNFVDPVSH